MNFADGPAQEVYGGSLIGAQKMARMPTCKERIDISVKQAEDRLSKLKEAQEILTRNPDLERLLDIMQQSHF